MGKLNLLLIGAGGHAHACIDVIEQNGQFKIAGLVGLPSEIHNLHFGYSVIATDDDLPHLSKQYFYAFMTLGHIQSPENRIRLYQQARRLGFQFPVIIAPNAYVSRHAIVGGGTIVMHRAIINAGAKVGDNCIINNGSLIEHDATVEDHCHISTGAIINGDVKIGEGSFIGSGSVIKEGIVIGKHCIIGLGLSVRHNQVDYSRFVGTAKS
jgi:sugar O-acyltransferase (sialic acid O-acetyltransferase NeuD family)